MKETSDQPEFSARSAWGWGTLGFLLIAGAILVLEMVDSARSFAWWKSVGGDGSWPLFIAESLLILSAYAALAFRLDARRRSGWAITLAIAALLLCGAAWIGQRV